MSDLLLLIVIYSEMYPQVP